MMIFVDEDLEPIVEVLLGEPCEWIEGTIQVAARGVGAAQEKPMGPDVRQGAHMSASVPFWASDIERFRCHSVSTWKTTLTSESSRVGPCVLRRKKGVFRKKP
jgi:hypothetical protein